MVRRISRKACTTCWAQWGATQVVDARQGLEVHLDAEARGDFDGERLDALFEGVDLATLLVDLKDGGTDVVDGLVEFVSEVLMRSRTRSSSEPKRVSATRDPRRRAVG